jgi:hypothetical protein
MPLNNGFIEVTVDFKEPTSFDSVTAIALPYKGHWTTLSDPNLWNLVLLQKQSGLSVANRGTRTPHFQLSKVKQISVLLPDNGSFYECRELLIQFKDRSQSEINVHTKCSSNF